MRRSLAAIAYAGLWAGAQSCATGPRLVRPSDPLFASVAVMGRVDRSQPDRLRIGYPGVTLRLRFEGPALYLRASSTTAASRLEVRVDGEAPRVVAVPRGDGRDEPEIALVEGLPAGAHTVDVVHRTETWQGVVTVAGLRLPPGGRLLPPPPWPARRLLLIGDSVTCGEAIDRGDCNSVKDSASWDPVASYGMILGRALDAQVHLVCYGGRGLIRDWRGKKNVLNAPQFFDLAVPDEHRAPRWEHAAYVPDAVIVSLGTNDFNLEIGEFPAREEWVAAYVAFVRAIRDRYPRAELFLTEGAIVHDTDRDDDDNDAVENDNNDGGRDGKEPRRRQRSVLRAYIDEVVRRAGDPRLHAIRSRHYPGDACNPHPTRAQHAAMARDLEPEIRRAEGW